MNFISTRGAAPKASFADVLLAGLAPDGGLYLPESWPRFTADEVAAFKGLAWNEAAFRVLSRFTEGSFSEAELREAIAAAYGDFDAPDVCPLTPLADGQYVLELFHGPTLAFKDVALQILGQLFARALTRRGGRATIVAATSGDTGSAAIAALGGLPNIDVFVMHPKGRVSDVQRLQMTTSPHANVHNIALEGSFDDAQSIVKALFADSGFAGKISLTAVNSINFARIAAQSVYYFTATAALGMPATFIVPTGNFGDIFAGEAAMRMGLAVQKLVIATNANDILVRALKDGVYASGPSHATLSPSMDIQVASNFERALFEASGRDADWTAAAMADFARDRKLVLPHAVLEQLRGRYSAFAYDDDATLATIAAVKAETGRILDPHTAIAASAGRVIGPELARAGTGAAVILSTAHPAKFPDAVTRATGAPPPVPARLAGLKDLPERMDVLPADADAIKRFISSRLLS
ncbi:MAG: threonine synthase [Alphaproteobacteria bacterium]|nr:threonine synthase [Alphaproteobacteria bacterium]